LYYQIPEGFPTIKFPNSIGYINFYSLTINLTSEIANISDWDATDYLYKRCDSLYSDFISGRECFPFSIETRYYQQCQSYFNCIRFNTDVPSPSSGLSTPIRQVLTKYVNIFVLILGIMFSVLNAEVFVKHKSMRNPFTVLILIQSIWSCAYMIFYNIYTIFSVSSGFLGFSLFPYVGVDIFSIVLTVRLSDIFMTLAILASFEIELLRFFKAITRFLSLSFPIWYSERLKLRHSVIVCSIVALVGSLISFFVMIGGKFISSADFSTSADTRFCPIGYFSQSFLHIASPYSTNNSLFNCIPQYILYDELFPLGIVILVLEVITIISLRRLMKNSDFSAQRKQTEKVLTFFIIIDLCSFILGLLRKLLMLTSFYADPMNSPLFHFSLRLSFFFQAYFQYDKALFFGVKFILYTLDMMLSQILLRRIQSLQVENGNNKDNWLDRLMMKFSKLFYKKVFSSPTTVIQQPSAMFQRVNHN
jgi:hypothetical protein